MKTEDVKIGMRVRVRTNNMNAVVVGEPEYWNGRSTLVPLKYEFSTRYELQPNIQIDLLPVEDQFPTHGGTFERPANRWY